MSNISNIALWFASVALVATALTACGKNQEKKADAAPQSTDTPIAQAPTKIYGTEDGECFAGIVRAVDAKHMTPNDYHNWIDKLDSKDKGWLIGFSEYYSKAAKIANANFGKTPKQLYSSNLIAIKQLNVLEGYMNVYQENDALKANALSTSACVKVGFTKGADLN
jgi:hypothetical protein